MTGEPIVVKRVLDASRERVFAAWTRPEFMAAWFFPAPGWSARVDADVRVGGKYMIEMTDEQGAPHEQRGEYVTIDPMSTIAFTWTSPELGVYDSLVTIRLEEVAGGRTGFELTHERLPADAEVRRKHDEGWAGCLANLEQFLRTRGNP